MSKLYNKYLQNTRHPKGRLGKLMLKAMNFGHASLTKWGLSHVEWQPHWHVLDIGCGGGATVEKLLKHCPEGLVYGVDASSESVAFASRHNQKHLGKRCFIELARAEELPFEEAQMDAVTAVETIYFWQGMDQAFSEVKRVLKPGGLFLVCVEGSNPENTEWSEQIPGMTVYSPTDITDLMTRTGFTAIEVYQRKREELCVIGYKPEE